MWPGDLYVYDGESTVRPMLLVNGTPAKATLSDGYFELDREWRPGDEVSLDFPMQVRRVRANDKVTEYRGKVALEYGPLVYAWEAVDNPETFGNITVPSGQEPEAVYDPGLLGGVVVLKGRDIQAVPYYAWSNRGIGKMKVWVADGE